jgi:hypothetical protein
MLLCQLHDEAAFAGTDFKMERVIIYKKRFPLSAVLLRFMYDPGACRDHIAGAGYIS